MKFSCTMLLLCVLSCGTNDSGTAATNASGTKSSLAVIVAPNTTVVATVNGDPIYDSDVKAQAEARGVDARTALGELVEMQLLAQEALRRGLIQEPDVIEESKRQAVRKLIEREFHLGFKSPADIPDEYIRKVYNDPRINPIYVRPEHRTAVYTRVAVKLDADDTVVRKALAAMQEIRLAFVAQRPKDGAGMAKIAEAIGKAHGVSVDAETEPYTTPRHGRSVETFSKALFSIKKVGGFSEVTRTKWGFDILQLTEISAPINIGLKQASAEIREKTFATAQREAFMAWMKKLMVKARVTRSDQLLSKIHVRSALNLNAKPAGQRPSSTGP